MHLSRIALANESQAEVLIQISKRQWLEAIDVPREESTHVGARSFSRGGDELFKCPRLVLDCITLIQQAQEIVDAALVLRKLPDAFVERKRGCPAAVVNA